MKVQLQGQALRLRIDEAELSRLLSGDTLCNTIRWPDGRTDEHRLVLAEHYGWLRDGIGWCVALEDAAVRELAERLPSRDGLEFKLAVSDGVALQVLFDVDVRDSARQRLPRHRREGGAP